MKDALLELCNMRLLDLLPRIRSKTLDALSLLLAIITAVLAYSDTQQVLQFVNPELAAKWQMFAAAALILSRVARVFGDILDDGKLNDSFGKDAPPPTPEQQLIDAEANRAAFHEAKKRNL